MSERNQNKKARGKDKIDDVSLWAQRTLSVCQLGPMHTKDAPEDKGSQNPKPLNP